MTTSSLASYEVFVKKDSTDNTNRVFEIINELKVLELSDITIKNQVEILRQQLETLVSLSNNFSDPKVLATSQELDEALNKLYRALFLITDNK